MLSILHDHDFRIFCVVTVLVCLLVPWSSWTLGPQSASWAWGDAGPDLDPSGLRLGGEAGPDLDPSGLRLAGDAGPDLDPSGLRLAGDAGPDLDPSGLRFSGAC